MESLARAMAVFGGIVLTLLVVLVCVSVAGRGGNAFGHWDWLGANAPGLAEAIVATGIGPVNGDFELVEAGIAFAIFAFLPICQLRRGHAVVDVFASRMAPRLNAFLTAFWEVLLACAILLIAWRLHAGASSKLESGETTFILQFPVWWAYAAALAAAAVAALVAVYCAAARVIETCGGNRPAPADGGTVR